MFMLGIAIDQELKHSEGMSVTPHLVYSWMLGTSQSARCFVPVLPEEVWRSLLG